jgi:membrane protease YdiL (CAAX protease family)
MALPKDPLRITIHLVVYVALYFISAAILGKPLLWVLDYLAGLTITGLLAALFANWLALRIYENRHLLDLGLWWNRASGENLGMGALAGATAACLVLAPPLLFRAAHFTPTPADRPGWDTFAFVAIILAASAASEEIFFRGYAFQILLATLGPYATIVPVGVVFALLHGSNPNINLLALINTAGFGIVFGYAYLRSRDLWLPIGLHFGWNFTLPLFGANVSGLKIKEMDYELAWNAGNLWSGGAYGPEGSILTSGVVVALLVFLWKAPVRRQTSPLTSPPAESTPCEPAPPLPS